MLLNTDRPITEVRPINQLVTMCWTKLLNGWRCSLGCRVELVQENHCIIERGVYPQQEWVLLGDIISKISGTKHISVHSVCKSVDSLLKTEKNTQTRKFFTHNLLHIVSQLKNYDKKQINSVIFTKKSIMMCDIYLQQWPIHRVDEMALQYSTT